MIIIRNNFEHNILTIIIIIGDWLNYRVFSLQLLEGEMTMYSWFIAEEGVGDVSTKNNPTPLKGLNYCHSECSEES